MFLIRKAVNAIREEPYLFAILALAFILRVVGIGYGLPLTIVADEPPFTLGALQMIQQRTLIPSLEPDAFRSILLYPPYISYLLIPPFLIILGVKYALWGGAAALFPMHVLSDLSAFFMTARLLNVVLGTVSVYLLYRISEALFRSRIASLAAAFLLATSILHQALSMTGRIWVPTSFIFIAVLFILTREKLTLHRRYLAATAAAGIGMGVTSLSALSLLLIVLYYLCFDLRSARELLREWKTIALCAALFVALAVLPNILWSSGNVFLGSVALFGGKSLAALFASPLSVLSLTFFSEPVLTGLFILGLALLVLREKRTFVLIAAFFAAYAAIFYVLFRFEARFAAPLVPFYALAAGYFAGRLWSWRAAVPLFILLTVPFAVSARVAYLAAAGDTREHAREWALENLSPGEKVLVFATAMRLPATPEAVAELKEAAPGLVRKTDEAEAALGTAAPHTLNNIIAANDAFIRGLPEYARAHSYEYVITGPEYSERSAVVSTAFAALLGGGQAVHVFDGLGPLLTIENSGFRASFLELFRARSFGPDIVFYRLQ